MKRRLTERFLTLSSELTAMVVQIAAEQGIEVPSSGTSIDAERIRQILRARRLREHYFSAHMFSDPAWDILLDLFAASLTCQRVSVSSLCIASGVPSTTALRWIKRMTEDGLLLRVEDRSDGRRVFVELSEHALQRMQTYFQQVRIATPEHSGVWA